ncbi:MAG: leucine--tRNA ligase, partial [Patescibacteria group bacterium]
LHGFRSNSKRTFLPWLKRELEALGHEVQALDLPDASIPNIDNQVATVLDQVTFGPNTILVGHSLGTVVALKVLEKLSAPIAGTILIAGLIEPAVKDRDTWPLRLMFNWRFDWLKIKKLAGRVKILRDLKDLIIADNQGLKIQQQLGGDLIEFQAEKPHVCGKVEPVVLEHCLEKIKVFTTRPDTLFGATYLVVAPEHLLIKNLKLKIKNWGGVEKYLKQTEKRTEIERTAEGKEKTGVLLDGIQAINPATGERLPIYVADYVLADYGFGAIMAVPAHDTRDWAFAQKFKLPIKPVIWNRQVLGEPNERIVENVLEQAYLGPGVLINSGDFSGLTNDKAKVTITKFVRGQLVSKYKLRDWVFSRQRYWGEPIPMIHCSDCALNNPAGRGIVPVPIKDLPVKLPMVKSYAPTGTGESPLAAIKNWVKVKCPKCGQWGKRETNTMPQWAGSSWYYLRFIDPHNKKALADKTKLKAWLPISMYVGGVEHATRHLIYARFWHKFLFDLGLVPGLEPFAQLKNQGLVLGSDGRKMSKRWGNVINPDDVIRDYGADSLRLYEMFMGPFEQSKNWNSDNLMGVRRFLDRVWRLTHKVGSAPVSDELETLRQKTIQKVSQDITDFSFNTVISTLMILANALESQSVVSRPLFKDFLKMLAPLAPHLTEELWSGLGEKTSVHLAPWPVFDPTKIKIETLTIVVQINGKVRDSFEIPLGTSELEIKNRALLRPLIIQWTNGQKISRMVYVPGKLLNLVLS